jgi:Ricin-type beta-trefoil lectin domain
MEGTMNYVISASYRLPNNKNILSVTRSYLNSIATLCIFAIALICFSDVAKADLRIVAVNSFNYAESACLDASGGIQATKLIAKACNSMYGYSQYFEYNQQTGQIKFHDLCLDALGAKGQPGDAIALWQCNGSPNQVWKFVPISGRSFGRFTGINNLCLNIPGGYNNYAMLNNCNAGGYTLWAYDTSYDETADCAIRSWYQSSTGFHYYAAFGDQGPPGYQPESVRFVAWKNNPSGDRIPVYEVYLQNHEYFYTTSQAEMETLVNNGAEYTKTVAFLSPNSVGSPVYRKNVGPGGSNHFYTIHSTEAPWMQTEAAMGFANDNESRTKSGVLPDSCNHSVVPQLSYIHSDKKAYIPTNAVLTNSNGQKYLILPNGDVLMVQINSLSQVAPFNNANPLSQVAPFMGSSTTGFQLPIGNNFQLPIGNNLTATHP